MPRPVSTLVLRAPCRHSLKELDDAVQCALRALPHLFRSPYVMSQQGVGELEIAHALRESIVVVGAAHHQRRGTTSLADMFEQASTIARNNHMKNGLAITTLRIQELKRAVAAAIAVVRTLSV